MTGFCADVAALFDAPVAVAATDPRAAQPAPLPGEAAHLATSIAKRQQEFAAGRAVARRAMVQLAGEGMETVAIPAATDRSPIWPAGWQGSITHKSSLCLAVVGQSGAALGLDVEEDTPLAEDLIPTICSTAEIARISGAQEGALAKLIFSAKEAAYKAQFPLTGLGFGFHRLDMRLDLDASAFEAVFTEDTGGFAAGDVLRGRFCKGQGHLVTGSTIGQSERVKPDTWTSGATC